MKKTKFSKVVAVLFALIMVFTSIPVQALAASPTDLNIQDGKVVLFSDMNEDQVKQQLFNALVTNKECYNYQDYEWEYGDLTVTTGQTHTNGNVVQLTAL